MTEKFGIYAASRALRHGRLEVTSAYYTDTKSRKTLGMGGLLVKAETAENVINFESASSIADSRTNKIQKRRAK